MFNGLFKATRVYQAGLDAMWMKHNVILDNIANANTPNFKAGKVEFESAFRKALQNADAMGVDLNATQQSSLKANAIVNTQIKATSSSRDMKMDGNNVDMEFEQAELVQNKMMMDYLTQKLNGNYNMLRSAIREGR